MSKRIKFNVLDFSIVLFAVFVIVAVIFWDDIRDEFAYEEITAEYTFKITNLSEEAYRSISAEDKVTFVEDGKDAGTILEIKGEKESKTVVLDDGSKRTYVADTYVATGKILAKGRLKENGFYIDGEYFVVAGKKFKVQTWGTAFDIEITSIINK